MTAVMVHAPKCEVVLCLLKVSHDISFAMLACEKRECVRLLEKMMKNELFTPISLEDSSSLSETERKIVEDGEPEALSAVIERLENNEFKSFKKWKKYMKSRWRQHMHALEKRSLEESLLYGIFSAQDQWFKQKCLGIPHSGKDAWILCLSRLTHKLRQLMDTPSDASEHGQSVTCKSTP